MPPPPVSIYVTSLTSQPKVRQNTEMLRRGLRAMEIPFTEHDLVMDEAAKTRWQRAKPPGQVIGLPGYLVGGEWVGTMDDFEYANESGTLPTFLKQDQELAAGETSASVGEAELERLMREMTNEDLDALAAEVIKSSGGDEGAGIGKVGLINPEGSLPADATGDVERITIGDGMRGDAVPTSINKAASVVAGAGTVQIDKVLEGGLAGISSAAVSASETITDAAKQVIADLGGPEAHTGTKDDRIQKPESSSSAAHHDKQDDHTSPSGAVPSSSDTPSPSASASASASTAAEAGAGKYRRMSKEEIAAEMMSARTVEALMSSLDKAEGKEKVD